MVGTNPDEEGEVTALSLERIRPTPHFEDEGDPASPNWYKWRIGHWGTKWDVDAERTGFPERGVVTYTFDSAWTPPLEAIRFASMNWPDLEFILEYDEPAMDFAGTYACSAGTASVHIEGRSHIAAQWAEEDLDDEEDLPDDDA